MAKAPTTTTAPTGQLAPFGLRMLPELKQKIEAAAKASGRSMNAEIVSRLQSTFGDDRASMMDRIELYVDRIAEATKRLESIEVSKKAKP